MGFHATIAAGTDQFGNMRHKVAPRVRVTEKVTGSAQVRKFHELAGAVKAETVDPMFTDTMMALALSIAGRKITRITETVSQFRKEGTTWVLKLSQFNVRIIVKRVNTKEFTGWQAFLRPYGTQALIPIPGTQFAKGDAANTNGERAECCSVAMSKLQASLFR